MTWAQRLKRVFGIEIETCEQCGGKVRVIASIEDPAVIGKILGHLASRAELAGCVEHGPRCTNPELTARFAGPRISVDRQCRWDSFWC